MGFLSKMADRLVNVMSGQGTSIDRRTAAAYVFNAISDEQAEAAYRTSWLVRKIIDVPPLDMTREWRNWQASKDKIEAIEKEEKRLQLRDKCKRALILSRLYGGAAILLGTGDENPEEELNPESVKKDGLRYLRVMPPRMLSIGAQRLDPEDPYVDQPEYFEINAGVQRGRVKLHPSRVITFIGQRAPEGGMHQNGSWFWGDPILQSIAGAVQNAETTQDSFAALVDEAKLDILKMPGLTEISSTTEGAQRITNRLNATMMGKSTWRALLIDAEDDWQQRQINWAGIPDVMNAFLQVVSGAADIPVTRLLGQSPKGLQSTGDGEERDYHAMIAARQEELLTPALDRIDELLIRSATGSRDSAIYYEYAPLSELNEKDAAEVESKRAQTVKTYGDTGLIPEKALSAMAKNAIIESGQWPGSEEAFEEAEAELAAHPELEEEQLATQAANENQVAKLEEQGAVTRRQANDLLLDARPRTLYVQRKLLNAEELIAWAKRQGFETTVPADDLHVTVLFSRKPVDWLKMGSGWDSDQKGELRVAPGGARIVEPLGDKGAVVLLFASSSLSWRHEEMVRQGAGHDFDEYQPHVTITYEGGDVDLSAVEPFRGELRFGPEIFQEVDDDWSSKLVEDSKKKIADRHHWESQPRGHGPGSGGGKWIKAGGAMSREEQEGERREVHEPRIIPLDPDTKARMLDANRHKTVEQLVEDAKKNQAALRAIGAEMQKEGIDFHEPPKGFEVKTIESINRKVRDELYSGPHMLSDISRASIVVTSPEDGDRAVALLGERGTVYDRGWNELPTGYLDRKVYLAHPNGGVSEIQIVPKGVYQAKNEGGGHELYEVSRLASNPFEKRQAAVAKMEALYGKAVSGTPFENVAG